MGVGMDYGHLISISLDKISSETEGCGGGNGRKNHEMDLRKALLVAHFIESIQNYSNDHNQYVNELRYNDTNSKPQQQQQYDDASKEVQSSRSGTSTAGDGGDESAPSATVLQCVINNSDSQTSRYCQYTMPVVCSVNTQQVMSSTPYANSSSDVSSCSSSSQQAEEVIEAPEVVIGGDDLDVSVCCEIESTPLSDEEDAAADDVVISADVRPMKRCLPTTTTTPASMGPPLPKKKRPLPKEILESCMKEQDDEDEESDLPGCFDVSMEEDDDEEDEEDYATKLRRSSLEDYGLTPPSTMTLQSMTSTSVSTSSRPKVLVQVTDSARYHQLNSWNRMYLQQQQQQQQQQQKLHPQPEHAMAAAAAAAGLLF